MRTSELTREWAAATTSGVRSPLSGHPGDNLDPRRLMQVLREAEYGDPLRQLELAEVIEERDPHYLGVLGTRRRSVSQLDVTVEAASDDETDKLAARELETWLRRDELQDELFDLLDAIGKGYNFTEIMWERSMGQWSPGRLEYRDPRWFTFDRTDLSTPYLLDEGGQEIDVPAFKFIQPRIKAKSGIAPRSGLSRTIMWAYLFKKFSERDWAIFTQTYAHPLRLGKFGPGSSEEDRSTLMRAVANIAGDCAAIIPESMSIEFVDTGSISASGQLYLDRCEYLDKQISKATLGQTATTDAETGGLGSGKEHRLVQEDIERADASALSAAINRDLVRPFMHLNYPGHPRMPRIKIARPEAEDLAAFSSAIGPLVDRGFEVAVDDLYRKFGIAAPKAGAKILRPQGQNRPQTPAGSVDQAALAAESAVKYPFNTLEGAQRPVAALSTEGPSEAISEGLSDAADRLGQEAAPAIEAMLTRIEAMTEAASSLEELREMILSGFGELDESALAKVLATAFLSAQAGGRAAVEEESDG
jgi:phage gp29-like protein